MKNQGKTPHWLMRGTQVIRFTLIFGGLMIAFLFVSAPSFAQDVYADPSYGTVGLAPGFQPSPHSVAITAGGDVDASVVSSECAGLIATAPDFNFLYTDRSGAALAIWVQSEGDTTLVINAPDGHFYCDDNSRGGMDPVLLFGNASRGIYNIWVGSKTRTLVRATLHIAETAGE